MTWNQRRWFEFTFVCTTQNCPLKSNFEIVLKAEPEVFVRIERVKCMGCNRTMSQELRKSA